MLHLNRHFRGPRPVGHGVPGTLAQVPTSQSRYPQARLRQSAIIESGRLTQAPVPSIPHIPPLSVPPSKRGADLLDALEDVVLRDGFARLSVSTIAARLSCSKRTLYELAPSKRELVLTVLDRFFQRIRIDAEHACADAIDAEQRIYAYLQAGVRAAERLSQTTVGDIHGWPPARQLWRDHVRLRVDGLTRIIDSGIREGMFRDVSPAFVAEVVFASINRLREPDFYDATDLTIAQAFDELYGMLVAGLTQGMRSAIAARPAPRPSSRRQRARD